MSDESNDDQKPNDILIDTDFCSDPLSTSEILSKFDGNVPEELDPDDFQSNVVHPHHLATSCASSIQCKKSVLNKVTLIVTWVYEDPTLFRARG
ncbi:unnamed protein product [Schistosoma mattheei]|uniref:Uncharacterized protein n=1 Tax=Schistosoma mattheei TaxID=31246 RepID=A0A183PRV1_9TREM|nr:unnamed protein product [Schistosoma mattheei]